MGSSLCPVGGGSAPPNALAIAASDTASGSSSSRTAGLDVGSSCASMGSSLSHCPAGGGPPPPRALAIAASDMASGPRSSRTIGLGLTTVSWWCPAGSVAAPEAEARL